MVNIKTVAKVKRFQGFRAECEKAAHLLHLDTSQFIAQKNEFDKKKV